MDTESIISWLFYRERAELFDIRKPQESRNAKCDEKCLVKQLITNKYLKHDTIGSLYLSQSRLIFKTEDQFLGIKDTQMSLYADDAIVFSKVMLILLFLSESRLLSSSITITSMSLWQQKAPTTTKTMKLSHDKGDKVCLFITYYYKLYTFQTCGCHFFFNFWMNQITSSTWQRCYTMDHWQLILSVCTKSFTNATLH